MKRPYKYKQNALLNEKENALLNEKQYRLDFYNMVVQVKPLFQSLQNNSLADFNLNDTGDQKINSEKDDELENLIIGVISTNLQSKFNEAQPLGSLTRSFSFSSEINLDPIYDFLKRIQKEEADLTKDMKTLEYDDFKSEFFDLASDLSALLRPSYVEENLLRFYEIDSRNCLNILFSETKTPLEQAVFFNFEAYEGAKLEKRDRAKSKKLTVEAAIQEILKVYTIESCNTMFSYQNDIKMLLFKRNDPRIIAGNIMHDCRSYLLESCIKGLKNTQTEASRDSSGLKSKLRNYTNDLKSKEISKFTQEMFDRYMSVSSMTDYEQYINKVMETVNELIKKCHYDLEKIISQDLSKGKPVFNSKSPAQGIEVLICAEYIYLRCKRMLITRIHALKNMLLLKDNASCSINKRKAGLALLEFGIYLEEFKKINDKLEASMNSFTHKDEIRQNILMQELIKYMKENKGLMDWMKNLIEKKSVTKDFIQNERKKIQINSREEAVELVTDEAETIEDIIQEIQRSEFEIVKKEAPEVDSEGEEEKQEIEGFLVVKDKIGETLESKKFSDAK